MMELRKGEFINITIDETDNVSGERDGNDSCYTSEVIVSNSQQYFLFDGCSSDHICNMRHRSPPYCRYGHMDDMQDKKLDADPSTRISIVRKKKAVLVLACRRMRSMHQPYFESSTSS